MNQPMLTTVLGELQKRKGSWREIALAMDPDKPDSYYSWLTKLAQGVIREPSVNRIQRLFDYFEITPIVAGEACAVTGVNPNVSVECCSGDPRHGIDRRQPDKRQGDRRKES